jgi:hypothetical protein
MKPVDTPLPGSRLRTWAEHCFDRATLDLIVLPAIADLQHECARDRGTTRVARVRAYSGVWKVFALCAVGQIAIQVRPTLMPIARRMAITVPFVTVALGAAGVPWLVTIARNLSPTTAIEAAALLLPGTLVGALPVAFFVAAVLTGRAGVGQSRRQRAAGVMASSLACTAIVLALATVAPPANQAFRYTLSEALQRATPDVVEKPLRAGWNELGWRQLADLSKLPPNVRLGQSARRSLHQRAAWAVGVLPLGLLAVALSARWRSTAAVLLAAIGGVTAYLGAFYAGAFVSLGPHGQIAGVWAPAIVTALLALGLFFVPVRQAVPPDPAEPSTTTV